MGQSPTRHRWLRFSLRGLLIGVTLVAIWLGWNVHVVRQRKAALAELKEFRPVVKNTSREDLYFINEKKLFFVRKLMGDAHVDLFMFGSVISESEKERLKALFPEAEIGTWIVPSRIAPTQPKPFMPQPTPSR